MFTILFWKATAERAIKTAAQAALIAWGATTFTAVGDIIPTLSAVGLAALSGAILSVLTSIASDYVSEKAGPSLTDAEVLPIEGEA